MFSEEISKTSKATKSVESGKICSLRRPIYNRFFFEKVFRSLYI